jgi:3-isopropylmalate/(R)-2-methylmalate dehydratase small subunit
MERFTTIRSPAAPLMLRDVDTDVIIPMRRLVAMRGGDLGRYAFEPLRYGEQGADGPPKPEFVLNRPEYADAEILLAGENFGCGSSREPAVWAVRALGYRCVIAPSFGDIFFKNCFQSSLLPIVLPAQELEALAEEARAPGARFTVDLERTTLTTPGGRVVPFEVNAARREALLEGLDDIGLTLKREAEIAAFAAADRERRPWIHAIEGPEEG